MNNPSFSMWNVLGAVFLGGWMHYIKLVCRGNQETEDVPLVEFMYLVFTCMPGELP